MRYGVSGELTNADWLEAGFSFPLTNLNNIEPKLAYIGGQADKTFEDIESLEATTGAKYWIL